MASPAELGDKALQARLGARLRGLRLNRNESQEQLAGHAGIGKATLQRLEEGRSGTLVTFLRVLRALDLADGLDALLPEVTTSPLEEARRDRRERSRARGPRAKEPDAPEGWRWGDESDADR
jgi:transcriptional regulator with XRE-family HTH domain